MSTTRKNIIVTNQHIAWISAKNAFPESHTSPLGRLLVAMVLACATAIVCAPAHAQYPERVVRLIVPFPAGSANDLVGRAVADRLAKRLGKPVIVDNRAGAAGMIGTSVVVAAPADGYTLLLGSSSTGTTYATRKQPDADPREDLTPLAMVSRSPMTINIPAVLPPKTLNEFIDYAKASPGKYNYGTVGGSGSIVHLYTLLFLKSAGLSLEHIPYPGSPQAVPALMENQVQLYIVDNGSIVGSVQTGRIRVLATASDSRVPTFPQVPTTKELGLPFNATAWYGIFAPKKLPADLRKLLQDHLLAVLADEGFKADMARRGAEPGTLSGEDFANFLRDEIDTWRAIVREAKLELQ